MKLKEDNVKNKIVLYGLMVMKYQEIHEKNWDYLIILDACRFDYFKKYYKNYFSGSLEKRKSRGTTTRDWLAKTFKNYYDDITYISANPYINGQGIPLKVIDFVDLPDEIGNWNAIDHFPKIIDVWNFGWDKNINTVHPKELNNVALSVMDNNRKIIHYLQPHRPVLHPYYKKFDNYNIRNRKRKKKDVIGLFRGLFGNIVINAVGEEGLWRLRNHLGMKPSFWERVFLNDDVEEVYGYNVKIVLKQVSKLVEEIDGKIIITADHGESLGENGVWGHKYGNENESQLIVPWLEIDK